MDIVPLAAAPARTYLTLAAMIAVLIAIIVLLAYTAYAARHARFEVDGQELRIQVGIGSRAFSKAQLDIDAIRRIDLQAQPEFKPRRQGRGGGLPGYRSGTHRLRSGEQVWVQITDPRRVVYLPTSEGYALMLSPADPEGLIRSLRERLGGDRRP